MFVKALVVAGPRYMDASSSSAKFVVKIIDGKVPRKEQCTGAGPAGGAGPAASLGAAGFVIAIVASQWLFIYILRYTVLFSSVMTKSNIVHANEIHY